MNTINDKLKLGAIILLVLLGATITNAQDPAQLKELFARSQQQNAQALKQYTWKSRNEVKKDGESKSTQVFLNQYDAVGNVQKSQIGGSAPPAMPKGPLLGGIAQKKKEEFMNLIQALGEQVKAYNHLPPTQMPAFLMSATISAKLDQGSMQIHGEPVLRPVKDTNLSRVINTRVLILRDDAKGKFYLHLMDGWMEGDTAAGEWRVASNVPRDLQKALTAAAQTKQVDLLDGDKKASLREAMQRNALPMIYTSFTPAELLQAQGEPQFAPIEGTQLLYVTNSENDIFVDTATQHRYVLISGRWFRADSMNGPWAFVAADRMPADFAKILATHAKASVLASVPGTPQAKDALIANEIPQTATITRSAAKLTVVYDGQPQFRAIENTRLAYAVNTPTPVIKVEANRYYAVQNGVWFVAATPNGIWEVTASVPTVVYTIPPSSSVHHVTYVKVYGATSEVVYVGYTPGYYGTVVSSSNVVVYGTGWYYRPYIGTVWYGTSYTYGYGAGFTWSKYGGWGVAYGIGYGWSNYYYPVPVYAGYSPAYGCCVYGGVAAANVYGQWGNVAYSGTRAAWANPYTGNVGQGGAVSGVNTATGTRYNGRGFTNTNVYTSTTVTGGGGTAYNPYTGRTSAGQAGVASNAYTGNAAAGTRGAGYNPQTDVVSGGAVGGTYNAATGENHRWRQRFRLQHKDRHGRCGWQ